MCHGKHVLLEIRKDTRPEYLTTILYKPKTTVPEIYFDVDDVHSEELQKNTITDF